MNQSSSGRFWLPGQRQEAAPPNPTEAARESPPVLMGELPSISLESPTSPLPDVSELEKKPNVLIIMTDDQAYGDLSCMGSEWVRTPHIDRLAVAGCLCTAWYSSSAACSPARASLMTGLVPGRAGVRSMLSSARDAVGLPGDAQSLGKLFSAQGYKTAFYGKWHLGAQAESLPMAHRFSSSLYFTSEEIDPFSHLHTNPRSPLPLHDLWEDGTEAFYDGEYITDLITGRALHFLRERRKQPFCMILSYPAPHYPLCAPRALRERFSHLPPAQQSLAAAISGVDDGVGQVLDELVRQNAVSNTLIFFTSDNGPSREPRQWLDGSDRPFDILGRDGLKGAKYSLFEGGIRMPGIICWPGAIPAGQLVLSPVSSLDVLPTALAASGGTCPDKLDGINLLPYLSAREAIPQRDLYFEMMGQTAIRSGRWKLVLNGQEDVGAPIAAQVFLADLENDRGETANLYEQFSTVGNELADRALNWRMNLEDHWQRVHAPRFMARRDRP